MNKSVTVTLNAASHFTNGRILFKGGEICRFTVNGKERSKRIVGLVKEVDYSSPYDTTLTLIKGYRPAPRSVLRNRKTVFSKIKARII